jgi:hypothetical protein
MSISNLFNPNDYDLFANSLTVDTLTANTYIANTLEVNTILSNPPGGSLSIQGDQFDTTGRITMQTVIDARKLILYTLFPGDTAQFFGFGVSNTSLIYEVSNTASDHVFYAGVGTNTQTELLRIPGSSGGITLPTSGGVTKSVLNYYEVADLLSVPFTGIWAASQNINVGVSRLGNIVTLTAFGNVSAAVTGAHVISGPTGVVPSRFRPPNNITSSIIVLNNSADAFGTVQIASNGNINIYNGPFGSSGGTFTASGNGGFYAFTISYVIS